MSNIAGTSYLEQDFETCIINYLCTHGGYTEGHSSTDYDKDKCLLPEKLIISSGTEKPYYLKEKGMTSEGCFIRNGSRIEQMTNSIDGMSQEELVTGCSRPRNREIMRVFKDVELVEQLGSGMNRMMKAYSPDIFTITPNFFHTVFKYKSLEDTNDEPKENLPKEVPQVAQRIFDFIKFQPKSTLAEMSKELGISERSIKNHIAVLKKEGFIERVGGKTYGYWKILGEDER